MFIHLTRINYFLAPKSLLHGLGNAGINRTIFMVFAIPTPKYDKVMHQKQYLKAQNKRYCFCFLPV